MCDYSLTGCKTRDAEIGDQLVSGRISHGSGLGFFPGQTATRGFHAPGQDDVAVCLRPGTELAFEHDVTGRNRSKLGSRLARFREINEDNPHTHHDALEFDNGVVWLVNDLAEGERCRVLQLPADQLKRFRAEGQTVKTEDQLMPL